MNNYQEKYKSISTEKMLSTQDTKGYQKLRRLVRWYLYLLSYAYNFCKENKTTMFYWLWKLKSNTLINNHFIIKYKVYGMVTRRNRRLIPWYSTTSLFFDVLRKGVLR